MKKTIFIKVGLVLALLLLLIAIARQKLETGEESLIDDPLLALDQNWTGDFDGMVKRNKIRVLVPYSKTFYFLDGAKQAGITYEGMSIFEEWLNKELNKKLHRIHLIFIPTPKEDLLNGLREGRGDIAAGNLTITPERKKLADFSDPFAVGGKEIIVANKQVEKFESMEDLSGKEIFIRPSSSYYESLKRLNEKLKKAGRRPIKLIKADSYLGDEDILEMINAGLISITAVDEHLAVLWSKVFENLRIYRDLAVRTDAEFGWAFRKSSPKLKEVINRFVAGHKQHGRLFNIITNRYLKNTKWVKNALAPEDIQRFSEADDFFKKYADQYGFDWILIAALAYQESGINQSLRSPAGAIGVMQMLPSTAREPEVNVGDIRSLENNIHAGVKYLRNIRDRFFENEPMDEANKTLFAMASYNAGPTKVTRLRNEADRAGYDPNLWFRNVEVIAAKRIGRETVQYVSNIYKYYVAYRLIVNKQEEQRKMREKI